MAAISPKGKLSLVSRNRKSFNGQYPYIVEVLSDLPENTVIDGEIVALDDQGQPKIHLLFSVFIVICSIHHHSHDTYMTPRHHLRNRCNVDLFKLLDRS
jgi:hypothetical protein